MPVSVMILSANWLAPALELTMLGNNIWIFPRVRSLLVLPFGRQWPLAFNRFNRRKLKE